MSTVRPFRAVRPKKEMASSIAALPYDVYNTAEARQEIAREPLSFLCGKGEKLRRESIELRCLDTAALHG